MRRPPNRKLQLIAAAVVLAAVSASLCRTPVAAQATPGAALLAKSLGAP